MSIKSNQLNHNLHPNYYILVKFKYERLNVYNYKTYLLETAICDLYLVVRHVIRLC